MSKPIPDPGRKDGNGKGKQIVETAKKLRKMLTADNRCLNNSEAVNVREDLQICLAKTERAVNATIRKSRGGQVKHQK